MPSCAGPDLVCIARNRAPSNAYDARRLQFDRYAGMNAALPIYFNVLNYVAA